MLASGHGHGHGHDIDLLESGYDLDPNPGNDPDHPVVATYRLDRVHVARLVHVVHHVGAHARLVVGHLFLSFALVPRPLFDVQFLVSFVIPRHEPVSARLRFPFVCASPRDRLHRAHPVSLLHTLHNPHLFCSQLVLL